MNKIKIFVKENLTQAYNKRNKILFTYIEPHQTLKEKKKYDEQGT